MSTTELIVYVLTALAAVVVLVTRLRLGRRDGTVGRASTGGSVLAVHTVAGVLALVVWVAFLVAPDDRFLGSSTVGIVALALWWVVVAAGLMILVRWLPTRGKHASAGSSHGWLAGPGLSILGHVGMLLGVCYFTWAYLFSHV